MLLRSLTGILLLMAVAWWLWTLRHRSENLLIGEWKSNHELTSQAIRPFGKKGGRCQGGHFRTVWLGHPAFDRAIEENIDEPALGLAGNAGGNTSSQ